MARARLGGYFAGLAEGGLAPDPALVATGDFTEDGGRAGDARAPGTQPRP
ncbi:hypothetical protein [Streptomyces sp. NRRL F-2580]